MSLLPIIPVEIKRIRDGIDLNPLISKREQLINGVRLAFENGEIIDMNDCTKASDIKRRVLSYSDNQFKIKYVKRSSPTYKNVPDKILESIQKRIPSKLGSSCGIIADGSQLTIFVFEEDYGLIKAGTVFLDARVFSS
jgi:hypothetical protein